jgi:hypothetical protein
MRKKPRKSPNILITNKNKKLLKTRDSTRFNTPVIKATSEISYLSKLKQITTTPQEKTNVTGSLE